MTPKASRDRENFRRRFSVRPYEDISVFVEAVGRFGNTAAPIRQGLVKEFRQLYAYRKKPWTDKELQPPVR